MNTAEATISNKKMQNRTSKRVDAQPGKQLFDCQKLLDDRELKSESCSSKMIVKYKSLYASEDRKDMMCSFSIPKASVQFSKKRAAPLRLESEQKRQKRMDHFASQQCSMILKALMTHSAGWVFNQPVDPMALNIPDYFSIISDPMDLGTIKSKLQRNKYVGIDQFAADVRLTFRNAMLYNPASNNVHKMAYELSEDFEKKWILLEDKWFERSKSRQGKLSCKEAKDLDDTIDANGNKLIESHKQSLPNKSCSSERKIVRLSLKPKVTEEANALKAKISCVNKPTSYNFYEGTDTTRIHSCDTFNDKKLLRLSLQPKVTEAKALERKSSCVNKSTLKNYEGTNVARIHAFDTLNEKKLLKPVSQRGGTFNSLLSQCSFSNDFTDVSSDISLERPLITHPQDIVYSCKSASDAKFLSNSQILKSDSDSEEVDSVLDSEDMCLSNLFSPAVDAPSDGWRTSISEIQLSQKKALRAAMLKNRFADTILKAQQKMLLNNGEKVDPMKMQQEKMEMERRQREEKKRIEAQIKAEEAATRIKAEAKLKQQREKEREAARAAITTMEKTVRLDENQMFLKELEKLSGVNIPNQTFWKTRPSCKAAQPRTPLERLGLYLKDDFFDEDD